MFEDILNNKFADAADVLSYSNGTVKTLEMNDKFLPELWMNISEEDYFKVLMDAYDKRDRKDFSPDGNFANVLIPLEIFSLVRDRKLSAKEQFLIRRLYQGISAYMFQMPNAGAYIPPNAYNMGMNGQPYYQGYTYKSKVTAGVLGLLLGSLGIHNFYLGKNSTGVVQLLMTVCSCGILSFISGIWGFVEGIMLLTGSINTDGNGLPLK